MTKQLLQEILELIEADGTLTNKCTNIPESKNQIEEQNRQDIKIFDTDQEITIQTKASKIQLNDV